MRVRRDVDEVSLVTLDGGFVKTQVGAYLFWLATALSGLSAYFIWQGVMHAKLYICTSSQFGPLLLLRLPFSRFALHLAKLVTIHADCMFSGFMVGLVAVLGY
jgi:hypothetical protein